MQSLRRFFADKSLEMVISGVCLQLLLTAVIILLGNRPLLLILSVMAIAVLLAIFLGIKGLMERPRPRIGDETAFQIPRKGIIFTLGLGSSQPDSVVHLVMQKLTPEYVGFLGTSATDRANVVSSLCSALSLPEERCKAKSWDPTDIQEGKIETGLVIDWMLGKGLGESDIVLDLTGGTATMSIAAFMAAEERHIDCEYIYSEFDSNRQRAKGTERPILITRYEE